MGTAYLLRHGETAWNIQKVFRGQSDVPLTENGRKQAGLASRYLRGKGIAHIYTSPLSRASETAQAVGKELDIIPKRVEGFTGMGLGQWQGKPHREVREEYPDIYELYENEPQNLTIPGGETYREVQDRVMEALEEIEKRRKKAGIP